MRTVHELEITRRCPGNDALDRYQLRVETGGMVKVEAILAAVEALPEKAFQEEITIALAEKLGCAVTTVGHHSGVKTTCSA